MRAIILQLTCLMMAGISLAQAEFYMSNQTVDDCKGILYDSENGDISGNYDHNENYTFTICIPGTQTIVMEFYEFCTEEMFDFITIYDGPDTMSTIIFGPHSGEIEPPLITAYSGCLTINFTSDPNVACTGWEAEWWVDVIEPLPPNILPITNLPCESTSMTVTFDEQIPCDSIYVSAFSILGPQIPGVVSVSPNPCSGGTTNSAIINFTEPLAVSGNYQVTFVSYKVDECGEVHELISTGNFSIIDCPLFVSLDTENDEICEGDCTTITSFVSGGLAGTYSYTWSPVNSNSDSVVVCPTTTTSYTLLVSDANGSTAEDVITITVLASPAIDGGDITVCQTDDPFFLSAMPPGGEWVGDGVIDENTGEYDPGLVLNASDVVTYTDLNGCSSSINVSLIELDPGTDDAACPGSLPFFVSGGNPVGGTWSGPNIQSDGLFTPPPTTGSFEVTYTHPNGCSGSKFINIDTITMPLIDSICQSDLPFAIPVIPFGGEWSGSGIVDIDFGMFDPDSANIGNNVLVYNINGCSDSLTIFVKEIDAGYSFSACPEEIPFNIPGNWSPAGGVWQGVGIIDSATGLYDPSLLPNGSIDTLYYTANGCTDIIGAFIRQTEIQVDNLIFCLDDDPFVLNRQNTGRRPWGGIWSGPGVFNIGGNNWAFDPATAGVGQHVLYYEANTCIDSMSLEVFAIPIINNETICVAESPIALSANPPNGYWSGVGIINGDGGIFDPAVAGVGNHTVYFESNEGCDAQGTVTVIPFEEAIFGNLDSFYCFKDTIIDIMASPPGGQLLIDGVAAIQFNPASIGPGNHIIEYSLGQGACFSSSEVEIEIGLPVSISLPFGQDSICYGENISISALGSGGINPSSYTYTWNQGLGFGSTHFVNPLNTTTYSVLVEDGCSEPASANLTVFVHPQILTSFTTGEPVCFVDTTWATINASPPAEFDSIWDSDPPTFGPTIESNPVSYNVSVTNVETNCSVESSITLPGFNPIRANFGISPNVDCISSFEPEVELLDFSVGGINGYWDFGDGSPTESYNLGENLSHVFPDSGVFTILLHIENEGFCESEYELEVCVKPEHTLFAPNAFTPNYDGKNDFFQFKGIGIDKISFQIYNRWGQIVYEGKDIDDVWDGKYKNKIVPPGVFTFLAKYTTIYNPNTQFKKGFVTVVY